MVHTDGVITGDGGLLLADVDNFGVIDPGFSPGILTIDGGLIHNLGALIYMELDGLIPGFEHDQLIVNGEVQIFGDLIIELLSGYTPDDGDTFKIFDFDFGNTSGFFNDITVPSLGMWDVSQVLTTGEITYHAPVIPLPTAGAAGSVLMCVVLGRRRTRRAAG